MKKDGDIVEYTEEEVRQIIDEVARKTLRMSGEEATKIILARKWKRQKKNFATWSWLDGMVFLLPEDPRRKQPPSWEPVETLENDSDSSYSFWGRLWKWLKDHYN